jgi:hypothetical protein
VQFEEERAVRLEAAELGVVQVSSGLSTSSPLLEVVEPSGGVAAAASRQSGGA